MKNKLLDMLISTLLGMMSQDVLKEFANTVVTFVEKQVKLSPNKIDDAIVLPMCTMVRKAFDVRSADLVIDNEPVK